MPDTMNLNIADITGDYDYIPSAAQAGEPQWQASAVLSTQPIGSTAQASGDTPPINSAQAAVSTAKATFVIVPACPFTSVTSIHPFWAIRRMPASALLAETTTESTECGADKSFNCTMIQFIVNVSVCGACDIHGMMDVRRVALVGITTHRHISKGSELLMQTAEPTPRDTAGPASKRQRCWQPRTWDRGAIVRLHPRQQITNPQ